MSGTSQRLKSRRRVWKLRVTSQPSLIARKMSEEVKKPEEKQPVKYAGAITGAAVGAAAGVFIPVIGPIAGAVIGGTIGYFTKDRK